MHRLKNMKETLVSCVQSQLADIKNVDTKELGEAIDMIKDLEEAMYYCTIRKAMEEKSEKEETHHYYTPAYGGREDYGMGRMYYDGDYEHETHPYVPAKGGTRAYTEFEFPMGMRDAREGRSPVTRRNYMESKEMHKDKGAKIKELEQYMKDLTEDIVEMIKDASPEEKQMLEKKITSLASKVSQLNV